MTIERQYNWIIFICDVGTSPQCEETLETEESDFTAAYSFARSQRWGAVPLTGNTGWIHHCGKCPRP